MNIAAFASGGGSNFQAILDACLRGAIPARMALCVASRPDAGVITRAEQFDIPVHVLSSGASSVWLPELMETLEQRQIDLIVLAGFMRLIPEALVARFPERILNIHPALLPDFGGKGMYGMHVHRAVVASGATHSGATVHIVDESYDTGAILAQEQVEVLPGDSPEELAARVLAVEHELYPRVVKAFAEGRINKEGSSFSITPA